MSRKEKLIRRLRSKPKNFTFEEARTLLGCFGYVMEEGSGSRVRFDHDQHQPLFLHEPHPGNELHEYQITQLIRTLEKEGLI
ncbi:MAG: type II toxin-antitoxin system HicA family toxin [Synergistaceae bacterium]|nr:type II toxin-antitoxin system HicA family toxin [Synergistaceae bacterium]